jgi:type II secretory ATPase GspE/PulE/Tfp pilus assembly ATPase PilB-like protein
MWQEFDRKGYMETSSFAITVGADCRQIVLLKCIDSRIIILPLKEQSHSNIVDPDDCLPCELMKIIPERVVRVTLEQITPTNISSEIHIEEGSGIKAIRCSARQGLGFAFSRKCTVFVRRSLIHASGVTVTNRIPGNRYAGQEVMWTKPLRDPLTIAVRFGDNPIVRIANTIIRQALLDNASEILIDPDDKGITVRSLANGSWHESLVYPCYIQAPLTAALKNMASLSSSLKTEPQEGMIPIKFEDQRCDITLNTIPGSSGEQIRMRFS